MDRVLEALGVTAAEVFCELLLIVQLRWWSIGDFGMLCIGG